MPDCRSSYHFEFADDVIVYGKDHTRLGTLVQKIRSPDGCILYGVLAATYGLKNYYVPIPWAVMRLDSKSSAYIADVDRSAFLQAPQMGTSGPGAFDDNFANRVDMAFGMGFPDIETLNDFA